MTELNGDRWHARLLAAAPLIAPARQFTFPFAVPGEEDALARGAMWLEVRAEGAATWLAQCALGFAGAGVAHGLWPLPGDRLLACAGGYAYAIEAGSPEQTTLLPPRPAVAVCPLPDRTIFVTHHGLVVREADAEVWTTTRLSWEGVTVTKADGDAVHGAGWDMMDDVEVPFRVDLRQRTVTGGGYGRGGSPTNGSLR